MPTYQPGDTVRLSTTFLVAEVATDPTTVTLEVTSPAGSTTTYTYVAAEVTRDSAGVYHRDVTAATAGIWSWRWTGTGTAAGVDEGTFTVQGTLVGAPLLCSVDDVREFLQKPDGDTAQDDVISAFIVRASRAIMNHAGREFAVEGTNPQTRAFDLTDDWSIAGTHGIRIGDLQSAPTAVSFTDAYGTAVGSTITPATDVVCLPQYRPAGEPIRRLRLRPTVSNPYGTYTLTVTGSWGFPVIPADVVQACVMTVGIWMRRDIQAFTTTFNVDEGRVERPRGLPSPVIDMLAHYRGFGIG